VWSKKLIWLAWQQVQEFKRNSQVCSSYFLHTLLILALFQMTGEMHTWYLYIRKASNYWPISITSSVFKIFEHILSSHITKHLEDSNILPAWIQMKSFMHISLFHDLSLNYDNNIQIDLISLDIAKVFDTVAHQRLLYKLQHTRKSTSVD